jgi:two-component system sensor histidine kinase GlrK
VRLTIFWRVILAQLSLIVLLLFASFYALSQLHWLTNLSTNILALDSACIEAEKRLLQIFLAQIRNAEKYLLLRDKAFLNHVTQGNTDFHNTLATIAGLVDTSQEKLLLEDISALHAQYTEGVTTALSPKSPWRKHKAELSEGIIDRINTLMRLREEAIARKTESARDQAAWATEVMGWIAVGGVCAAILLAYFFARGVSRPLKKLAEELRGIGKGEFHRSFHIRAPKEVSELAQAFNWMAERLTELDGMKADFIAHMSHELRTPITAIQEGTALLLEEIPGPLSASQREILEVVQNHTQRLFHGLSSVLDLSKMEAGMMEYNRVPSDLLALIEGSIGTVQLIAQKKQIRIDVSNSGSLPLLSLDEGRIQQVLDNLLSNAVKFTPEGGTIRVAVSLTAGDNGSRKWVEVSVADSGIGIPAGEEERIFERFYQSRHRQREHWRGTGLGLAIARYVVEAHGGRIWAESRKGEGASFFFTLPVEEKHFGKGKPERDGVLLPNEVGYAA